MRNRKSDKITLIVCSLLLTICLLFPSTAKAADDEGGKFNASEMIFGHIGDSYEWHFTNIGDKPIAIPLPIIVYSHERGEWFFFSSSRVVEGEAYNGFYIAKDGNYSGKLVEKGASGEEVRPLDISLTKNACALLINSLLLIILVLWCARWYKKKDKTSDAPKGFVGFMEMMVSMVYEDIIKANIPVHVQRYAPYLLCAFFFIFLNNLIGLIPGSANLTGNIAITLVLAFCTFLMVNLFANKEYWKEIFWADVPLWMKPVMAVVEFLGIFTKPIALMIRLFANIMAGHAALLALVSVIFITFSISSVLGGMMTPLTVLFCIFLDFLEVLVAFIQAYVFTMLSAVFIGLSQAHHHEEHN
ncbi:MAG: F0F1 ATP synthase subunit A [Bacteroidaceae bacterium]|nr:F0F1 ATP synthase subunit A [Bacteroidaceae bacterium]